MNSTLRSKVVFVLAAVTLMVSLAEIASTQQGALPNLVRSQRPLPNPVLFFIGHEVVTTGGKQRLRFKYSVENFAAYPNEMFAAAPDLPPCGNNTKASRTWVDIYDQSGKKLNGFCALGKNSDLNNIWFALEGDVVPPSWVYIELNDRKTGTKYKSNLADTVQ